MGLLSAADVEYIQECQDDIASDIEEDVTYRQYTGLVAGDAVMGTPDTYSYTDLPTTASARELTLEEVQRSGGVYVLGDMEFRFRQTVLAAAQYNDLIVFAGATFKPKSITHKFLGGRTGWIIRARKQ